MAKLKLGSITLTVNGYFINNGVPYYQRSIPADLWKRFGKKSFKISLRNERQNHALVCHRLYEGHTQLFAAMRNNPNLAPSHQKLAALSLLQTAGLQAGDGNYKVHYKVGDREEVGEPANDILQAYFEDNDFTPSQLTTNAFKALNDGLPVLLSEAFSVYLENHTKGKNRKFADDQKAHWNKLISLLGDIAIESVDRNAAKRYRDFRLSSGVTRSTVIREIATIKAIFNSAIREIPIKTTNPFEHLNVQSNGSPSIEREPYTTKEIQTIIDACNNMDDERRRLICVLAVTGARLSEIIGLRKSDFNEADKTIRICEYGVRTTKTDSSVRTVPLVAVGLSAIKKQFRDSPNEFLFPTYATHKEIKAGSASGALNKWAKKLVPDKTMHCFRHSLQDLLREVECPDGVSNAIGGWTQGAGAASSYGLGYSTKMKFRYLSKAYAFLK